MNDNLIEITKNGQTKSPKLPDHLKNYIVDIDGIICEDCPNEDIERMKIVSEISGAKDIFDLASAGQKTAQAVIQETAHWLGYGLALAAMVLNPDAIVIGGGVSKAGLIFLEPVEQAFQTYTLQKTAADASLRLAQLGNDAGVIGAARLIAQKIS